MIDAILYRLGFVRIERAKTWAIRAHDAQQQAVDRANYRAADAVRNEDGHRRRAALMEQQLARANRRLERAGMISVTTFL